MHTRPLGSRLCLESLEQRRLLASAGTLLQYDFTAAAWQTTPGALSADVTATRQQGGYGTIDTQGSTTTSGAIRLTVNSAPATPWSADLASGPIAVANTETNLGKLTLGFSLSASQAKPVTVVITSYDAAGNRTGARQSVVIPAAAYAYQRYAVDLSTMTAAGPGTFDPAAPKVSFDFCMSSAAGWNTATAAQLRVDNVHYAKPAYYVSALTGSNSRNGLTEATAFATPQKALELAQPGDIIVLMNGTYTNVGGSSRVQFTKGGTPAAWVSLKNYPGHSPRIYSEHWNAILIGNGNQNNIATGPAVAYVEVRGLHVQGSSAKVGSRTAPDGPYNPDAPAGTYGPFGPYIGQVDGRTNGNGITADGRYETNRPHDIRFADNLVEDNAGGGISAQEVDRIQIENNVVRDNCYWDIYATSGISILSSYQFDGTTGQTQRVVRNNVSSGNIHKQKWAAIGKYSDGNGIILDYNHNSSGVPDGVYNGRTLVTNNVTFDNGGSGIHAWMADHVDIINNVAYRNSASPYLQYGQIYAGSNGTADSADDVNIFNNIMVAPVANLAAGEPAEPVTGGRVSSTIVYKNNVYFGGNIAAPAGTNNVVADPKFVLASVDPLTANFRLQSVSPAINRGIATLAPAVDITNAVRYAAPDGGAYEFVPAAPAALALTAASDTGTAGDNMTRLNNATTAAKLSFNVSGTLSGATVQVYAGAMLLGSAVAAGSATTVTTDGLAALPDGAVALTAKQTFASAPSAASSAFSIMIDTARPTLVGTPVINAGTAQTASRSQVRTVTWTFSSPVIAGLNHFVLTNRDTGAAISLASRVLTVNGNAVTLNLDAYGTDAGVGLFLGNANYDLTLSPAVSDDAGNTLDANGDGVAGETPRYRFFKLLGDFSNDRRVTSTDYLFWNRAYGRPAGPGGADVAFDLNADGRVSSTDYLFWNREYNKSIASLIDGLTYA